MEAPKRRCSQPGCRGLVTGATCDVCGERRPRRDRRGSAASRGYDAAWRRRQAQHLAAHPLCEVCLVRGLTRAGRIVHHTRPVSAGNPVLVPSRYLVSCCSQACHDAIEPFGDNWRLALRATPPGGEGGSIPKF